MWTSPGRARLPEATWLVPLAGLTAGFLVTDSDVARSLTPSASTVKRYKDISNYGVGAMAGAGAGFYFMGLVEHKEHPRETGFLSGEAAINSLIATEAIKYAAGRERPYVENAAGKLESGGNSFPSERVLVQSFSVTLYYRSRRKKFHELFFNFVKIFL